MSTVLLLGELGQHFGKRHHFDVRSPAEAVRALVANFADFERFILQSKEHHLGYRVLVGKEAISERDLHGPVGANTITIAPVIAGAGGKFGQIILGVALIAASFYLPTTALFSIGSFAPSIASLSFSIGLSLTLGGVAQMLAPQPASNEPSERPENQPSYTFNGAVNTTAQGQPVPVGYGRVVVGSAVISAGIDVDQVAI
ncbi:COG4723 Phage-related protein, tail component [Burkholderiales bacterium]